MLGNELNWKDQEKTKIPALDDQVNCDIQCTENEWVENVKVMVKESLLSWKDDGIKANSPL